LDLPVFPLHVTVAMVDFVGVVTFAIAVVSVDLFFVVAVFGFACFFNTRDCCFGCVCRCYCFCNC